MLSDFDEKQEQERGEVTAEETRRERPALTLNIYSWMTPIFGVLMLLAGVAIGYLARPLITRDTSQTPAASVTAAPEASGQITAEATEGTPNSVTADEAMTFLIEQVRHFKGEETAKVTIIEFSDFQ